MRRSTLALAAGVARVVAADLRSIRSSRCRGETGG
jgi:hypothetical protein